MNTLANFVQHDKFIIRMCLIRRLFACFWQFQ